MGLDDLDKIYRENASTVFKYLMCVSKDANIAEELLQETFYQATKTIDKFRGDCKVTVWLCQIAKRLWYKELQRRGKTNNISIDEMEDTTGNRDDIEAYWIHYDVVELYKELHKLDEKTREVMYMRLSGVLSFKEIGDILDESETWARVTFYRGKQKLAKGR
jgi:RNA polymerase sigma-70 factor (ECF subfamily)